MRELEAARQQILDALPPPQSERVALDASEGRVLAAAVTANVDLPTFDNSAMDGYAVRAEDVRSAGATAPVALKIVGRIAAGERFAGAIKPGECVRLFTGSPLPDGADAVVMQEDTNTDANQPEFVQILDGAKPWENIRLRGVDVRRSEVVCAKGEILTAGRLALLAGTGTAEIQAGVRPRVGLLATGSELAEPGTALAPGQVFESNRLMLASLTRQAGGVPEVFPIVRDTLEATCDALEQAFACSDFVVTSGGVSVGELDFVKEAFTSLGGRLDFWKISMRPGRPFVFGRLGEKFIFGLPGNPVSAFVTFVLLVRPAIRRWQGALEVLSGECSALLGEPLANPGERRHFVRVKLDGKGNVFSAGLQESHALKSLADADGLLELPPKSSLEAGAIVRVIRLD